MTKLLKSPYFFLVSIIILTIFIYSATLANFPEGDDFLFLWHIRVPVSFQQVPFTAWDQPMAGRYGYGQAWYGAAIHRLFGFDPFIFNFLGIVVKIIALISVYIFAKKLTDTEVIALTAALFFAVMSTGVKGEIVFFLQFALLFLANFLISSALLLEGLEQKKVKKIILSSFFLLAGNYLYTIRAFGIILLPLWTILRFKLLGSIKLRLMALFSSITIVLLSTLEVAKFIPNAEDLTSRTLIEGIQTIIRSVQNGYYEYIRSILLSISLMAIPLNLYSGLDQLLNAGAAIPHYLKVWATLIWIFLFLLSIFPLYLLKSINKYQLGITFLSGIIWNFILLYLTNKGINLFHGGEVVIITLGIQLILIGIILGIVYFNTKPAIASTLLVSISSGIIFYIPNWLHDPIIVSTTEFRYLTVSSGFVAVFLAIFIYLIFKQAWALFHLRSIRLRSFYLILATIFTLAIFVSHIKALNQTLSEVKEIRRPDIIENHWDFVKSRVDFSKKPLIVMVWTNEDLFSVKTEFFKDETLGLIGNLPWDDKLFSSVKLFYSYEESQQAICNWKQNGINFDYNNFYQFKITSGRGIIDQSIEGREKLKTWKNFCEDKIKGLEFPE